MIETKTQTVEIENKSHDCFLCCAWNDRKDECLLKTCIMGREVESTFICPECENEITTIESMMVSEMECDCGSLMELV